MNGSNSQAPEGIAVIGMAGHFPGAQNIEQFWQNLCNGVEAISFFSEQELDASRIDPALRSQPNYVKARAILDDIELFDASFFDITPKEAMIMDPQQRHFLEIAWTALENAGYDAQTYLGRIGVYAGTSFNTYFTSHLQANSEAIAALNPLQVFLGIEKDFLTTRVSYKLNLRGSSITIQTACSSSLVAISLACESLLTYQNDIVLAGGVSISVPQKTGYLYTEGGIASSDGHCRAFDQAASGTVSGNGVGVVVLKRLEEALEDGDYIHAIIRGSAVNNDGAAKIGYTAPGIDGQAQVIATALAMAGVEPETITYVEGHGTGTSIGDPIEVAALTQAFSRRTTKKGFCALGSVKTNIGHLDAASGVAGFIKTVLALREQTLPPSLHFERPNPRIDFENSPFYVNTALADWRAGITPRRAGVSSFGIGGTNAHVILEEPPPIPPSPQAKTWHLLLISAKTPTALEIATKQLATYVQQNHSLNLDNIAYTLQVGRRAFNHRRVCICHRDDEMVTLLEKKSDDRVLTGRVLPEEPSVVFLFPGQGSQHRHMAQELYQDEPVFRLHVDRCAELFQGHLGIDLRAMIYFSDEEQSNHSIQQLQQTIYAQPALFTIEYALAQLWIHWGIQPQAMVGHSIGEYVAACLAGVFSLEDAIRLVAVRSQMMQGVPVGSMLTVRTAAENIRSLISEPIALAATNSPSHCVLSGPTYAIEQVRRELTKREIACNTLQTSHAFHSSMMETILVPFAQEVAKVSLHAPRIPYISNVTGTWITVQQATSPDYWSQHLRLTVRFTEGIQTLLHEKDWFLLEVGPGQTLSTLVKHHTEHTAKYLVLASLPRAQDSSSAYTVLFRALGQLWLIGMSVDWQVFSDAERSRRVPLPTYPFERQRYWIEPKLQSQQEEQLLHYERKELAEWLYIPSWKRDLPGIANALTSDMNWLLLDDELGIGSALKDGLERAGQRVITVAAADSFSKKSNAAYTIHPGRPEDYHALLNAITLSGNVPQRIIHAWGIKADIYSAFLLKSANEPMDHFFFSLLFLMQALRDVGVRHPTQVDILSNNLHNVTGDEQICPEKAMLLGPCRVIPQEYANVSCRSIDITLPASTVTARDRVISQLFAEITSSPSNSPVVAYRGAYRWLPIYSAVPAEHEKERHFREEGVYLITGGLGGIGFTLARHLAETVRARLILVGRTALPERSHWEQWIATHGAHDPCTQKMQGIQALEKQGAKVLAITADVCDYGQMSAVIDQAYQNFGSIHGIIHAAGVAGEGVIQFKTRAEAMGVLGPKVLGTMVLDTLVAHIPLDFFVLCSSLASLLGNPGQVDYCAANAFLDAFAYSRNALRPKSVTTINWGTWQDVGMAVNAASSQRLQMEQEADLSSGILPAEGIYIFEQILRHRLPQVIVSPGDLAALLAQHIQRKAGDSNGEDAPVSSAVADLSRLNILSIKTAIVDLWSELLGIEKIDDHDTFDGLGGDSLVVLQLLDLLRETFQIKLAANTLLEASTVVEQAEVVLNLLQQADGDTSEDGVEL